MQRYDSTDSNVSDYEFCAHPTACALPFDPSSIESVILNISDRFDLRVVLGEKAKQVVAITSGMATVGGIIGQHYGGSIGSAVGTAVGGACGLGIAVISMRDIWQEIRARLADLFELVYDFLAGMGIDDYRKAASLLVNANGETKQLAMIIVQVVSDTLGKRVLSSLTPQAVSGARGCCSRGGCGC